MNNELLLITGGDIPFIEAQLTIHQPTNDEIGLIGEEEFFSGCQLIKISKDKLSPEDKVGQENKSDFDIFMSIMCSKEKYQYKDSVMKIFSLLFPNYKIKFMPGFIALTDGKSSSRIDEQNFYAFKDILDAMFCLSESETAAGGFNPVDAHAKKIADKIKKGREKIAHSKGNDGSKKVAIFSNYISVLAVGLSLDINLLKKYTVFQLMDAYKRFMKKQDFDYYIQAKMAGADKLEEVDNWMNNIHP